MEPHAAFFIAAWISVLILGFGIIGSDGRITILRTFCFRNYEKDCNSDFIDVHKNLSVTGTGKTADTYFLLYTRKNPEEPEKLHMCAGRLPPKSNFNPSNRIIILAHGVIIDYCLFQFITDWKDAILDKEDANIIAIDYGWVGLDLLNWHAHLKLIAQQIVVVLNNIKEQTGVKNLNIMGIGFSLGAQLLGFLGKVYKLDRIVAIDAGGPTFNDASESERLSRTDAKLVEFWHCNAGVAGATYDGGDYNYYINGGSVQKACRLPHIQPGIFEVLEAPCSHNICPLYFKESISSRDCQFIGVKCRNYKDFKRGKCRRCGSKGQNCMAVGYDTDKLIKKIPKKPQRLFVETNTFKPFCNNDYVDLDGYAATYKSFLRRISFKKEY